MTFPRLVLTYAFTLTLFFSSQAFARHPHINSTAKMHEDSAFYFADKGKWDEAKLHARKTQNPLLVDYVTWRSLREANPDADFADYSYFLAQHPDWPDKNMLITQAEDHLFNQMDAIATQMQLRWFETHPPISGKGKIVYATLLYGKKQATTLTRMVRDAWVNGDFDAAQEKRLLQRYDAILRTQDHEARIDRLIWDEKTSAAKRLLYRVSKPRQALFEARIALQNDAPDANSKLARVSASLHHNAGLLYERMKWRERKGLEDGVEEILLTAPNNVPYSEKWWRSRAIAARDAIDQGKPSLALRFLRYHGQQDTAEKADALWLMGWIELAHLNHAQDAYTHFSEMEKIVATPVSKARADYWLGRAAEAMHRPKLAQKWYATGATYPTVFYGQLAAAKAHAALLLPTQTPPTRTQTLQFDKDDRVRLVRALAQMGHNDETYRFLLKLEEEVHTSQEASLVAGLAAQGGGVSAALKISKEVIKNNIILTQTGYPYYRLGFTPPLEAPLMWAITRQESLFDPKVKSGAGAVGLMQLLPGTAQHVARKMGMDFAANRLTDPSYNLSLGSHYLQQMISGFDGSYILAIAAYNAGPSKVRSWIVQNGQPGRSPEAAIDWIERIPYGETRNYVQRVLENLQIYRVLLNRQNGAKVMLEADLVR